MMQEYQAMTAPIPPERLKRDDLIHLCAHLNQAHKLSEKMFRMQDPMVVRVPSGKYLAHISRLLGTPVRLVRTWGHHNHLSCIYNNVEFNTYEPQDGAWVDDGR